MDEKLRKKQLIRALLNAQHIMEDLLMDENRRFADKDLHDLYYCMNDVNLKLMDEPGVWL